MQRALRVACVCSLASLAGCGGHPLAGTWTTTSAPMSTVTASVAMQLGDDGSVQITVSPTAVGTNHCTGSLTYTGLAWTSSPMTITFSGAASCAGQASCDGSTVFDCSNGAPVRVPSPGACPYMLSADSNTLSLGACAGIGTMAASYHRQP